VSNTKKIKRRRHIHVMPEPYGSIVDRVCAQDRAYFDGHPEAE
jgi:hypothetical protein